MKCAWQNLGKAIAAVALALLMVVQVAPAVALAQQDGDQAVLTIQSSKSVVKGKGWKLTEVYRFLRHGKLRSFR